MAASSSLPAELEHAQSRDRQRTPKPELHRDYSVQLPSSFYSSKFHDKTSKMSKNAKVINNKITIFLNN